MGKSSSPPLACMMCAKGEWDFLTTLGNQRRYVAGLRFVDDMSCFVAYNAKRRDGEKKAREILRMFENCYDRALTLKRTDNDEKTWEFLGCELNVRDNYPYLGCYQAVKNEPYLVNGSSLTFGAFQDFGSWTCKRAKLAVIVSALHQIEANSFPGSGMIRAVILVKMELRRRDYPSHYFDRGMRNFSRDKGNTWKMIAELRKGDTYEREMIDR
ncbi:hypothetical protein CBR_g11229 [Chara braunii]|uniref:Reverse transcriptase domain-containing protein n=1 Tax=Chara braunii TaxID=69332 RepID=A0A388KQF0_CHABU|nr:hypothetical protein CBR_g11229 [Chara braunii]|eukprot:GBG72301.1 hypothetical protein CBR_g11229 [Chara braunii]